jgi:antitoxin ParD1/3/4
VSKIEKLSIALTPELAAEVREAVQSGDYASTSEVVREALRGWAQSRNDRTATIAYFRQMIAEGLASGEPQERPPLDEFLKSARARRARTRAA